MNSVKPSKKGGTPLFRSIGFDDDTTSSGSGIIVIDDYPGKDAQRQLGEAQYVP